jgi:hypothetical protein
MSLHPVISLSRLGQSLLKGCDRDADSLLTGSLTLC